MPNIGSTPHGGPVDLESRDIGTLFRSEVWWRDHYDDIRLCGYQLRPRYQPGWVPSWKESNKDFFSVEDGQPCLVRAILSVLSALTEWISCGPQWTPYACTTASESCSRRFSPKKGPLKCRSAGFSHLGRWQRTHATIVCHCSTLSICPTPGSS